MITDVHLYYVSDHTGLSFCLQGRGTRTKLFSLSLETPKIILIQKVHEGVEDIARIYLLEGVEFLKYQTSRVTLEKWMTLPPVGTGYGLIFS